MFSVKSAYHTFERATAHDRSFQTGESSMQAAHDMEDKLWTQIWKLPCPPKIKQFIWRVAHNSLALRMNIKRRHIELDTRCPVCARLDEDGGHCFLKCKQVKQCWRELNSLLDISYPLIWTSVCLCASCYGSGGTPVIRPMQERRCLHQWMSCVRYTALSDISMKLL